MGAPMSLEERQVRAARRFGRIGLALTLFFLLAVPAIILLGPTHLIAVLLPLYVVGLGLHVWRIRQVIRSLGSPAPGWFVLCAATIGLALALCGLASSFTGFVWALVSGVLLGDIVGGQSARRTAGWVLAAVAVVAGLGWLTVAFFPPSVPDPATGEVITAPPGMLAVSVGIAAFYVGSFWYVDVERLWWLKAVTDMDDSRRHAAELAAARERLRLADDLHDILGHALEVVAFKSELAIRLQAADPARATAEMDDVQRVARQSLREVRELVHETRPTDLVAELAGARAVLESAGVALVVTGDPEQVGPTARTVFGRVLREAMTNVLRHAQPSRCTIEIECTAGAARLRVVNDGVLPGTDAAGTGIAALRRHLTEHAGTLDAGRTEDGKFALAAELPA
ncbi:MAG: histidine kinase [Pseudonocardia sp.]|nr:histidine kinase [Pseudonocardia sp.]